MVPLAPLVIICFTLATYELIPKGSVFLEIQKGKVMEFGGRGGKRSEDTRTKWNVTFT